MSQVSENNREILAKSYQTTTIIVLIQLFSTIILIAVGWFLASGVDNSVAPNAVTGLWVALIALALASFVLGKVLFSWQRLKKSFEKNGVAELLKTLQMNAVILCLLAQIVAIIGFLIATLTVNRFEIFRAGAVAFVIFLFYFPRKTWWVKIVASFEKVS